MSFSVHISRRTEQNIRDLSHWIAKHSRAGAFRWLDALEEMVDRLADSAESYPLAAESSSLPFSVQEIVLCIRGPGQPPLTIADFE
jgi:plasmid stabilization system protein ParE